MNKSQRIQLGVGILCVVGGSLYLRWTGTLSIDLGKISTDLGVNVASVQAVSGHLLISPYDSKDEVLSYIAETKYHLDGWFYQITESDVIKTLDLLAGGGVEVRLIVERIPYGGNTKSYTRLVDKLSANTRIQIQPDDDLGINFNHTKVFLRDDQDVMIATANLSYPSFARNREYRVIVDDEVVVDSVGQLFSDDWSGSASQISSIHPSLLVCPYTCRSGLYQLFANVQESIDMQAQYISDPQVIDQLHMLQDQGVQVRLLVGEYQDEELLDGLDYRIQTNFYNHSKALLIDGEEVLIGSMNYSTNSIENNREISVILDNPQSIGLFKRQFEQDRDESGVW